MKGQVMERGQRCGDGKEARKREMEGGEWGQAGEGETMVVLVKRISGTMEPSNLLRWPRAPFNETPVNATHRSSRYALNA